MSGRIQYRIDPARSIALSNGWGAAIAVGPEGDEAAWLINPDGGGDEGDGCGCHTCAPHDQLASTTRSTP